MKANEKPQSIIASIDQIVEGTKGCQLKMSKIKPTIRKIINSLAERLKITPMQALLLSAFINYADESYIEIRELANLYDCPRIRVIRYQSDIDELCRLKLIRYRESSNDYIIAQAVIKAFTADRVYETPDDRCEDEDTLFDRFSTLCKERKESCISYTEFSDEIENLIVANSHLQFVKFLNKEGLECADKLFFIWCCNMLVNEDDSSICEIDMRNMLEGSNRRLIRNLRDSMSAGYNELITHNLLGPAFNDGFSSRENYTLTEKSKNIFLASLIGIVANTTKGKELLPYTKIAPKELFYNSSERLAVERLESLLSADNFTQVCNRLTSQGMRQGFACLFYGAPGTGKTETVLQLARKSGRDIMQVNISTIKSKWVGESEKNIKAIFDRYRSAVQQSEVAPILLFNEADAIISQRMNNAQRSVDKMDNAIQNIILEEMERLEGILIATTNLAGNMDKAFERRFIYKVEFKKPNKEAKMAIWKSMIPTLSDATTSILAQRYNFSGGEIENIARKHAVEYILTGQESDTEALIELCNTEQLTKQENRRIGF